MKNWKQVNFFGKVKPHEVESIYKSSSLAFALLRYSLAVGGNIGTLGNTKIFEILGAGIPVICTDFVLWKEIIAKYKCGYCINPTDIDGINKGITYLLSHPREAKIMGENGERAVKQEFNWESQERILLQMYDDLCN